MHRIHPHLVFWVIAGAALSGCGGVKLRTPWESKNAAAPEVVEATAPVRIDHYLLVALAGEGLHRESAQRVTRLLRDRLTREGQRVTLDLDYGLNRIQQQEFVQLFDGHFHTPGPDTWRQTTSWCGQMQANRMVICKVAEYRQYWQDDHLFKRIVLLAAIDDTPSASRLDRFQAVAEKKGPQTSFTAVEEEAADRILARIMGKPYSEPIVRKSWWPRWFQ